MNAFRLAGRMLTLALLSSMGLSVSPAPRPKGSQGFVISRSVEMVILPVTVTDRHGGFVSGLEQSNFRVYENGQLQTITSFEAEDAPVVLGLVIDHSGSMAANADQVIDGALALTSVSNPQDQEFVINFGETVRFGLPANVPFTSDATQFRAALENASASGRTALYDAIFAAVQHTAPDELTRKVLILVSDGGDNASTHTFAEVLQSARAANVMFYTIGLLDEHSADQNPRVLEQLARDTGGLSYFPSSADEVVRVCRQIAQDIRHQYTIGYNPAEGRPNTYRKVRVSVVAPNRGKLNARTRSGYFWILTPSASSAAAPGK